MEVVVCDITVCTLLVAWVTWTCPCVVRTTWRDVTLSAPLVCLLSCLNFFFLISCVRYNAIYALPHTIPHFLPVYPSSFVQLSGRFLTLSINRWWSNLQKTKKLVQGQVVDLTLSCAVRTVRICYIWVRKKENIGQIALSESCFRVD